jgi:hypothetical protein
MVINWLFCNLLSNQKIDTNNLCDAQIWLEKKKKKPTQWLLKKKQ